MIYEQTDFLKFALLISVCRLNPAAEFILLLHVVSVFIIMFANCNPVGIYCLVSVLYCAASSSEIKISSSIRYVLFAIGVLNFGAAFEFYAFEYQTIFYQLLPSAINALDLIIIFLLPTGGRGFVGSNLLHYIRARFASFNYSHLRYNREKTLLQTKGNYKK